MPATEHAFTDEPPARLYLDTDILVAALVRTDAHHQRSQALLERLVRAGTTRVFVSSLSWLELADVVTRERFRNSLAEEFRQRFNLHRWQQRSVRQAYVSVFLVGLEDLLSQFVWEEVALAPEVRERASTNMPYYGLRAHDAIHLASAQEVHVTNFASFDEALRRVDDLHLWNDRIHAR